MLDSSFYETSIYLNTPWTRNIFYFNECQYFECYLSMNVYFVRAVGQTKCDYAYAGILLEQTKSSIIIDLLVNLMKFIQRSVLVIVTNYIEKSFRAIAPHRQFRENIRASLSIRLPALEFCSRRRQQVTSTRRLPTWRVDYGDGRMCVSVLSILLCTSPFLPFALSLVQAPTPSLNRAYFSICPACPIKYPDLDSCASAANANLYVMQACRYVC